MPRIPFALALVPLIGVACTGSSPVAVTPPASLPPVSASSPLASPGHATPAGGTPTVAPTRGSAILVGDAPIIASDDGPPGHQFVLPAAATTGPDGSHLLFVVWFGAVRGDQVVTLATSDDGRAWTVGHEPIYTDLGLDLAPPGLIPAAVTMLHDGTWVLYGWGARRDHDRSNLTWRATAPSPEGPWTVDPEPVLQPGPARAWDGQSAAATSVLPVDSGFAMWYEGVPVGYGRETAVGLATSPDGVEWTKWDDPTTGDRRHAESDPVLAPGECGIDEAGSIQLPSVVAARDGYVMSFIGAGRYGASRALSLAESADGRAWSCFGPRPVLDVTGEVPGSAGGHAIRAASLGGRPVLLVESLLPAGGSEIWLAEIYLTP